MISAARFIAGGENRVKFKAELDEGHGTEVVASVGVPLRVD